MGAKRAQAEAAKMFTLTNFRGYVSGDVHTNTIEGFWSLTKRGIAGVFHSVSKRHLQGYLNEYACAATIGRNPAHTLNSYFFGPLFLGRG